MHANFKEHECTAKMLESMMHMAEENNISVRFLPFKTYDGRLKGRIDDTVIGIRISMDFNEYAYNLAHELSHYFLHYDKGNMIESEYHDEYEEQADRAARMLLTALYIAQNDMRGELYEKQNADF